EPLPVHYSIDLHSPGMTRIPEIFPDCRTRTAGHRAGHPVPPAPVRPNAGPTSSGWWHVLPEYHGRMWFRGNQTSDLPSGRMLVFRGITVGRSDEQPSESVALPGETSTEPGETRTETAPHPAWNGGRGI